MTKKKKGNTRLLQQDFFDANPAESSEVKAPPVPAISTTAEVEELLRYILALSAMKGVGFHSVREIIDAGIVAAIWKKPTSETALAFQNLRLAKRVNIAQFSEASDFAFREADKLASGLREHGVRFIPRGAADYPSSFLKLQDPPRWIFVKGNPESLHAKAIIAVVGTRNASALGLQLASQCAAELARRNTIVLSGLAKGIDEQAHRGAVAYYGQSIAVIGYGILAKDVPHDLALAQRIVDCDGSVVSEYLPLDIPSRDGFLRRNELQAALSKVVIPVEVPVLESGTGATIRRAMKLNTPVVGITPETESNPALQATKSNLEKLGFPVFQVRSENSKDLWRYMEQQIPEHDWAFDPRPRQQRFFEALAKQVGVLQRSLAIDEAAIDRLAEVIKQKVRDNS